MWRHQRHFPCLKRTFYFHSMKQTFFSHWFRGYLSFTLSIYYNLIYTCPANVLTRKMYEFDANLTMHRKKRRKRNRNKEQREKQKFCSFWCVCWSKMGEIIMLWRNASWKHLRVGNFHWTRSHCMNWYVSLVNRFSCAFYIHNCTVYISTVHSYFWPGHECGARMASRASFTTTPSKRQYLTYARRSPL